MFLSSYIVIVCACYIACLSIVYVSVYAFVGAFVGVRVRWCTRSLVFAFVVRKYRSAVRYSKSEVMCLFVQGCVRSISAEMWVRRSAQMFGGDLTIT